MRRHDLDIARGVVILLVVFGHLVARQDPADVTWYEPLRRAVYAFHMPFFLYLSGMVAVLSGGVLVAPPAWPRYVAARGERLLLPFFGLGLLIVCGKLLASHFMFVDNQPQDFWEGVATLLWHTAASPALSIWYLFVLFAVSVSAPLFLRGHIGRLWPLLGLALLLYTIPLPAYMYLDRIGRYAIFFVIGACTAAQGERWASLIDRNWTWLLGIFGLCLIAIAVLGAAWPLWLYLLPVGTLSMPVLHGIARHCGARAAAAFHVLGQYSFAIYLFNTLFIGLAKGLLLHVWSWNGGNFLPFAAALMAAGVLGPMALKRLVFPYVPALDRLTA